MYSFKMSGLGAGKLEDYSVDQLAGAIVLVVGSIAGLLQVIWLSKCHCKVNLCYIFRCERRPPTEEEMKSIKKKAGELKEKQDKIMKKEKETLDEDQGTPRLIPKTKSKENVLSSPTVPDDDIEKLV
jgi:hypothetical protein